MRDVEPDIGPSLQTYEEFREEIERIARGEKPRLYHGIPGDWKLLEEFSFPAELPRPVNINKRRPLSAKTEVSRDKAA